LRWSQGGPDIWTEDVLNLGVKPDTLIQRAAERFEAAGGRILSETSVSSVCVHNDAVAVGIGSDRAPVTARLLLDCMGHASPIVRQIR
jgi:lycopene cyclase CruP